MCRDQAGHYPRGTYVCTYEGTGEIEWGFDAKQVRSSKGRIEIEVNPSNAGILLRIDYSSSSDPIRNIRVISPGFENSDDVFNATFIERLRPFQVLRFMDWSSTNNSTVAHWSQRTTCNHSTQAGPNGVAVEYMIDLCNRLECDPWFCMPHLADDEYVRSFAKLVKERLRPDARLYIEWSNEAWNGIFEQAQWVQKQAASRGCRWTWVVADEARRDWDIWRDVFGEDKQRLIRVAAGQHYNPWVCQDITQRLDGKFDAIACGAYFFPEPNDVKQFTAATTPERVLDSCLTNIDGTGRALWHEHANLSKEGQQRLGRPIPLLAYEGGQHLTTTGQTLPYGDAYASAQLLPRMQALYERLFDILRDERFEMFAAFNYVGRQDVYGSWGHLRWQDEPLDDSPKFRALLQASAVGPSRGTGASKREISSTP
jgi:hypothetical protein